MAFYNHVRASADSRRMTS